MNLTERIDNDIKNAMRARETAKLGVLRMLKSTLKNSAIEKGGADTPLDDTDVVTILRKEVKKRRDSIDGFEKGGRTELAEKEREEITVLEGYLPKPLTNEEIDAIVTAAIAETGANSKADMGAVMKVASERSGGRAEGRTLSAAVQKLLN